MEKEKFSDYHSKNISEQADNLSKIESDVAYLLINEVDKLDLRGSEKVLASLMILKNVTVDIGKLMMMKKLRDNMEEKKEK